MRIPQQERSRATQQRLLDATVDCLIEHGWSGTTTTLVAEKAGVSRGAQLHHYPTKAALVLAAVEHLAARRAAEIRAEAASLPVRRLDRAVALLAAAFTGPLYTAALTRVGRELHRLAVDLLGADETRPGVRETVQATLDLLRGLGVANLLSDDARRRRRILATWTANLATVLTHHDRRPA
ncbi:MAG: TetR family transcriptional regulator [Actinobacteria bacterium 13_1_20CM_3_71_11]|nr:MAG: TetR family transcriptional regulator [Actinobacteria bacterium 13_1_20CM_3_71_11]